MLVHCTGRSRFCIMNMFFHTIKGSSQLNASKKDLIQPNTKLIKWYISQLYEIQMHEMNMRWKTKKIQTIKDDAIFRSQYNVPTINVRDHRLKLWVKSTAHDAYFLAGLVDRSIVSCVLLVIVLYVLFAS